MNSVELIFEELKLIEAIYKLAKLGAMLFRDYTADNFGYFDLDDESLRFLQSLENYPAIEKVVEELTRE